MSWGVITGDERLIPGSNTNEIKFESGKPKKVRLLLKPGQEPYSFFQHTFEVEKVENGQKVTVFRTVNCPKTKSNPYAHCSLCEAQVRRRIRHTAPAWDYTEGKSGMLTGGEKIWTPIGTMEKMGIDPTTLDWAITKTGTTRNDTDYTAVNIGAVPFTLPNGAEVQDPEVVYRPHTEDEMRSIVESIGMTWEQATSLPPMEYPRTLDEALNHVIPNTKYKGQTMKAVWDTNKGMIEFFAKSNRISPEKAIAQVLLVTLGGAQIPGVPNLAGGATYTPQPQPLASPSVAQPVTQPNPVTPSPVAQPTTTTTTTHATTDNGIGGTPARQDKINAINKALQTNQKFIKGGYTSIIDAMKTAGGGKTAITEFTDAELDKMLEICK